MGKASTSKKVARVARTGGGRTRRGTSSMAWPALICFIVLAGTALIVLSKQEQSKADVSAPRVGGKDHWHAALGFDICGDLAPAITDQNDPLGIHTHGDGIVHIHPSSQTAAGKNATLGKFFDAVQAKVTETEIELPGQDAKQNGMKCGDKPAEVRVKTWDSAAPDAQERTFTGNPSNLRPQDGQLITIAFLPADAEVPRPASAANLTKLTDVPGATVPSTPTPAASPPAAEPSATPPPTEPPASAPPPAP